MSTFAVGDRVWAPDEKKAWFIGLVSTVDEKGNAIIRSQEGEILKVKKNSDTYKKLELCGSHVDLDVENLVDLDELSEGAILHHVRRRFMNKSIYTHVGSILVAVNPFEYLPIYTKSEINRAHKTTTPYPHVFVTAASAYSQLCENSKNQSVLISGESGAGKTETTKKVLTWLAEVASDKNKKGIEIGIEDQILQSNPLLEAMGNAKTLRNNNSSRFGKWMKVDFDAKHSIHGCEIINYLLEKSRVVTQSEMERNYHIFYQLISGADKEMKERFYLKNVEDYLYLNTSGCISIPGVDDKKEFEEVVEALKMLNFSKDDTDSIFKLLSAVLLLGNIKFDATTAESCALSNDCIKKVENCAVLLGVDFSTFKFSLTEKIVQMGRGSVVSIKLTSAQACDSRDTLAKTLYGNMFDWLVRHVNENLKKPGETCSIGILDIFGFEVFQVNSFEQLCINYANEKLQFHFNDVIFTEEMKLYDEENVPTDKVVFEDNARCVNLIEGKPLGLISLLEEECSLGNGTDASYMSKIEKLFGTGKKEENPYFRNNRKSPELFSVVHFAGPVEYCVTNFLEKNRDSLSQTSKDAMMASTIPLISTLFSLDEPEGEKDKRGNNVKKGQKSTLGGQFRKQLISLVSILHETQPHFIRCVKPNHAKVPSEFDGQLSLRQLRYAGLFEAIKIRRSGYAYRSTITQFAFEYQHIVSGLLSKRQSKKITDLESCQLIFNQVMKVEKLILEDCGVIGKTKVFLKTNQERSILDRLKAERIVLFVYRIQSVIRGGLTRFKLNAAKRALQKEMQKIEKELQAKIHSVVVVQKFMRGYIARRMMRDISDLFLLRRYLLERDVKNVENILDIIQRKIFSKSNPFAKLFKKDVDLAKSMIRLIGLQDNFVVDMKNAVNNSDIVQLNRLLVLSVQLEMEEHPVTLSAKELIKKLHRKRRVMKTMIKFLSSKDGDGGDEPITAIITEAIALGVDIDFIGKVQRVYDGMGPRVRIRCTLRRAIETVDYSGMKFHLLEAEKHRKNNPLFLELEVRAANEMLRLLKLDLILHPTAWTHNPNDKTIKSDKNNSKNDKKDEPQDDDKDDDKEDDDNKDKEDGDDDKDDKNSAYDESIDEADEGEGPRLSMQMLEICDNICSATDPNEKKEWNRRLRVLAAKSAARLEIIIRSYKWSKLLCVWRYPEVQTHDSNSIDDNGDFYGLRITESRSCLHLIRTLHQDIDSQTGVGPASLQHAMMNMDLPMGVINTMNHLDYMTDLDDRLNGLDLEDIEKFSPSKSPSKSPLKSSFKSPSKMNSNTIKEKKIPYLSPYSNKSIAKEGGPMYIYRKKSLQSNSYSGLEVTLEQRLLNSRELVKTKQKIVAKTAKNHKFDEKSNWK